MSRSVNLVTTIYWRSFTLYAYAFYTKRTLQPLGWDNEINLNLRTCLMPVMTLQHADVDKTFDRYSYIPTAKQHVVLYRGVCMQDCRRMYIWSTSMHEYHLEACTAARHRWESSRQFQSWPQRLNAPPLAAGMSALELQLFDPAPYSISAQSLYAVYAAFNG